MINNEGIPSSFRRLNYWKDDIDSDDSRDSDDSGDCMIGEWRFINICIQIDCVNGVGRNQWDVNNKL